MTGRPIEATAKALRLHLGGMSVRKAAEAAGIAVSTLTRAKKRAAAQSAQPKKEQA